jgi:hypothetical protein
MNDTKIIVFGAGEITNLLIKNLTLSGQKVMCVTENSFGQIDDLLHVNLEVATYKEVINKELKVDTAIFSWKDSNRLNQDNQAILGWLESEMFQASKSFHLSSASVYKLCDGPQSEACDVLESNAKVVLEKLLKNLSVKKKILHTDLRISNVYGVDISYGFIGSLFDSIKSGNEIQILQNLNITRDYIHVEDVIYAIKMLLEIDEYRDCINISTGIGITLSQLLEAFSAKGFNFENHIDLSNEVEIRKISILDCKCLAGLIEWQPKSLNQVLNKLFPNKLT